MMIRVFFLIRALDYGGAERQLIHLVKGLDKSRFHVTVATFYGGGALQSDLHGITGVRLLTLSKQGRWDVLHFIWRLGRAVRAAKPQIMHGYMGVSNELCWLMGRINGAKVVWGLRASNMDLSRYRWSFTWTFRVGAWLSRFADLTIVNSHAGRRHHIAHGYCGKRMVVVHNGIDTDRFRPDVDAGRRLRREWDVAEEEQLLGVVARLDPMKDHPTFLRAAALLARQRPDLRFVCVGNGPAAYEQELRRLAGELGLGERLIWAGALSDMPAVYNTLDIAVSSSAYGEGFSNSIGEAMACGVPCVVTDVGDSAIIVANAEQIVEPGSPQALATAAARLLDLPREQRAARSRADRERIVREYNLPRLADATATLLTEVM